MNLYCIKKRFEKNRLNIPRVLHSNIFYGCDQTSSAISQNYGNIKESKTLKNRLGSERCVWSKMRRSLHPVENFPEFKDFIDLLDCKVSKII